MLLGQVHRAVIAASQPNMHTGYHARMQRTTAADLRALLLHSFTFIQVSGVWGWAGACVHNHVVYVGRVLHQRFVPACAHTCRHASARQTSKQQTCMHMHAYESRLFDVSRLRMRIMCNKLHHVCKWHRIVSHQPSALRACMYATKGRTPRL